MELKKIESVQVNEDGTSLVFCWVLLKRGEIIIETGEWKADN